MAEKPADRKPVRDEDDDEVDDASDEFDPQEYDTLMQLERLESLEEEMVEVGVTTLEELRERIARLHHQLDAG
ncbi:MAG TPA: hypothetical protein VJN88_16215 [Ktedonobacterales bacterium]|nr:hypothetical protein [Ktedonobacterales bacterium]